MEPKPTQFIDWTVAASTARRLSRPGPKVSAAEAAEAVSHLQAAALAAREPVAEISGLKLTADQDAAAKTLVVDRPTWAQANIESLQAMLTPLADVLARTGHPAQQLGGTANGIQAGGLLAFLSARVLGQYDPGPSAGPRLLLVAPNIVATERDLGVDRADFRLWVCLHEQTHRVQFTAVPWLAEHLLTQIRQVVAGLAPGAGGTTLSGERLAQAVPRILRGEPGSLLALLGTPEQRALVERLTAVMALLEGHADVIMDEVGPQVVPTVAEIRERFTARRAGRGPVDRLLRRVLGLEEKMRQYRDGAKFVRAVMQNVDLVGFNRVWTSPNTLPSPAEIADPRSWVRRVHG